MSNSNQKATPASTAQNASEAISKDAAKSACWRPKLMSTPAGMFNLDAVNGISETEKGVAIADDQNNLIHFIEEKDKDKVKVIIKELIKAVQSVDAGRSYQPDWDELGF